MTATRFGRHMTEITESIPDGRFKTVLDRAIRASECPLIMPQRWLDLKETHPNPNPNPNPHLNGRRRFSSLMQMIQMPSPSLNLNFSWWLYTLQETKCLKRRPRPYP